MSSVRRCSELDMLKVEIQAGFCEYGNETSSFVKGGLFRAYPSDTSFSKEGLCFMAMVDSTN